MPVYPLSLPQDGPMATLSKSKNTVWEIELHNGQDSRLTPTLVNALRTLLDHVELDWRNQWREVPANAKDRSAAAGALIIVGRKDQDKFFSNGLDLNHVPWNGNFFPVTFNPLLERLLTFPIPVICAINGHCFAGGFMFSLACDYRVMTDGRKRNAWLCMNEVDFGAVWPHSFAGVLNAKVGNNNTRRKIALEGHRFTPQEALDAGLVDRVVAGNTSAVLASAQELAASVGNKASSGVWGLIKKDLYAEALEAARRDPRMSGPLIEDGAVLLRSKL
ncbi:Acid protease [Mycena indigotica]|uniref:Acid protease n=1 Tax=Mycena indigotica TaxID=2126181 RepID=A0A8H6TA21_9AGAR|nr:Acid protease [Mycena indigotica]KAF7312100.1 Acid protease [Mycena indigotica]